LDALVLRRRPGGRDPSPVRAVVKGRPDLLAGEDLPPMPRQKRSLAKRARLKNAALALFGEKGYEATSIQDIAHRARLAVGGFYQHFGSKRQLLLALMDELLEKLNQLDLAPAASGDVRTSLSGLLTAAFSRDLEFLGAYRAWQEAALSDAQLARQQAAIHAWTSGRILRLFQFLQQLPGARRGVDAEALARVMDAFFWDLLAQAARMPKADLQSWIEVSTHLIYHALFLDRAGPAEETRGT
jgi:AcrR family transcriptional regulator